MSSDDSDAVRFRGTALSPPTKFVVLRARMSRFTAACGWGA